ncbi:metal ABC transporter permease [Streptantibioticus silvisoli]|uniref:Metal ABC transporter permease n=1 Tax=Streptantibioticus silvisoli TaxID=2705255 RepID=A0ABT6VT12_9ACTN|nr:metal ABC transporter permease [Streptantibioticus silvisoli]MDI5961621.1 metal ABC transporter permease [Streptantibioticus silvisoli]
MPLADAGLTAWSWNPLTDIQVMWSYPFMVNAFRAGAVIAVLSAAVGWFVVLRRQTFAAHTLAVVGFPGASGAVLVGVASGYGYFAFCLAAAVVIAMLPGAGQGHGEESALIGTVQAFLLACGFLFVALYKGFLGGVDALLFGSFLGIGDGQVVLLAVVAVVVLAVLAAVGRPLLFASVDPSVAAARALPVRALSVVFLVLLGAATAEASQITGSLLVFALLVMPPATAQLLSPRAAVSLPLGMLIGLAVTWLGLTAAYYSPYPVGFFVTTFAFAAYVLARAARTAATAFGARGPRPGTGATGGTPHAVEEAAA